jgi:hypothetical protein
MLKEYKLFPLERPIMLLLLGFGLFTTVYMFQWLAFSWCITAIINWLYSCHLEDQIQKLRSERETNNETSKT